MRATITSFDEKDSVEEITATLKRDGGVIIEKLASEQLMDDVYAEIESNVAPADLESNTDLWPPGNKTVGGLAEASPLFADRLLTHPKILDLADATLLPLACMGPAASLESEKKQKGVDKGIFEKIQSLSRKIMTAVARGFLRLRSRQTVTTIRLVRHSCSSCMDLRVRIKYFIVRTRITNLSLNLCYRICQRSLCR